MGRPNVPRADRDRSERRPKGRRLGISAILLIVLGVVAALTLKGPVQEMATQAVSDALGEGVTVDRIKVESPTRISLSSVTKDDVTVDEVRLQFDAGDLLHGAVRDGIKSVELVGPHINLQGDVAGGVDSLEEQVGRVVRSIVGEARPEVSPGKNAPLPDVRVRDGSVSVSGREVVRGLDAQISTDEGGVRIDVSDAELSLGEDPWHLRAKMAPGEGGAYRVDGSMAKDGAELRVSGSAGRDVDLEIRAQLSRPGRIASELLASPFGRPPAAFARVLDPLVHGVYGDASYADASKEVSQAHAPLDMVRDAQFVIQVRNRPNEVETSGRGSDAGERSFPFAFSGAASGVLQPPDSAASDESNAHAPAPWRVEFSGTDIRTAKAEGILDLDEGRVEVQTVPQPQGGPAVRVQARSVTLETVHRLAASLGVVGPGKPPAAARGDLDIKLFGLGGKRVTVEAKADLTELVAPGFRSERAEATGHYVWPEDRGSLTVSGSEGRIFHHPFTDLRLQMEKEGVAWRIVDGEMTGPDGEKVSRAEGSVAPHLDLEVQAAGVPLAQVLEWATDDDAVLAEAGGKVDGTLKIEGRIAAPAVSGEFSFPWASLRNLMVEEGKGRFSYSRPKGFRLDAKARAGNGNVRTDGFAVDRGRYGGEITFDDVAVPTVVHALQAAGLAWPPAQSLNGRVSGHVRLAGTVDAPELSAEIRSARLGYKEVDLAPFRATGTWSDRGWEVSDIEVLGQGEKARLAGTLAQKEGEINGSFTWQGLPLELVSSIVPLSVDALDPGLAGETSGSAQISGPVERLSGRGSARVETHLGGVATHLRLAANVTRGGSARVNGTARADGGELRFEAQGSGPDGESEIRGRAVTFPVEVVGALVGIGRAAGRVTGPFSLRSAGGEWTFTTELAAKEVKAVGASLQEAALAVDLRSETFPAGGRKAPAPGEGTSGCPHCVYGTWRLQGGLAYPADEDPVPLDLTVLFSGDQAVMNPLRLKVRGGRVLASGSAALGDDGRWLVDIASNGRKVRYDHEGVDLTFNYRLGLFGPIAKPELTGAVQVERGEVNLLRLPRSKPSSGDSRVVPFELGLGVNLDVRNVRLFARSLLETEIAGGLDIEGSASHPGVYGNVAVSRGRFRYLGSDFTIERGNAAFYGSTLLPRIDVRGVHRVAGVDIIATAEGMADDLAVNLTSNPPKEESEIWRLLGAGIDPRVSDGSDWLELARRITGWIGSEVLTDMYWSVGRALEEALNVDEFRIGKEENGSDLQLSVGKYLSPELYVQYRRSLDSGRAEDFSLRYSVNPFVRLKSDWGTDRSSQVGVEISFPF